MAFSDLRSVSDYDQGGYDDLVADTTFSLNEIVRQGELQPHWIPLYGVKGKVGLPPRPQLLAASLPAASLPAASLLKRCGLAVDWIAQVGLQDIREKLPHVPLDTCYKGRLLLAMTTEEVSEKPEPSSNPPRTLLEPSWRLS